MEGDGSTKKHVEGTKRVNQFHFNFKTFMLRKYSTKEANFLDKVSLEIADFSFHFLRCSIDVVRAFSARSSGDWRDAVICRDLTFLEGLCW